LLSYGKMLGFLVGKKSTVPLYSLVEDREKLLAEDSQPLEVCPAPPKRLRLQWTVVLLHLIIFCIAASLGALIGLRWLSNPDSFCTGHISRYCKSRSGVVGIQT
jgi:hypothetical protein